MLKGEGIEMGTIYPANSIEPEFIPTLGNMIEECNTIIRDVPAYLRNDYAKLFKGSEIEKLLFGTSRFEEEACNYCREAGWREPV